MHGVSVLAQITVQHPLELKVQYLVSWYGTEMNVAHEGCW
jgi:hypothetical protein